MPRTECSTHRSAKLEKPPVKAAKICYFHSTDRDTQVLLCGKVIRRGGETVLRFSREAASICFIEGPGMGERWMDSWDGPRRRIPTPQLFGSRCLLLGSTSKGEMWKNLSVN